MKTYHCQAYIDTEEKKKSFFKLLQEKRYIGFRYIGNGSYSLTFETQISINIFIVACEKEKIIVTQFYINEK